jgi:L-ascorbate metabolism protein UlaG (beta-lactamase superfamily)
VRTSSQSARHRCALIGCASVSRNATAPRKGHAGRYNPPHCSASPPDIDSRIRPHGIPAARQSSRITHAMFSVPPYRGPKSDHFDGTRFYNQCPVQQGPLDLFRWILNRDAGPWRKWADTPPGPPPPERVEPGIIRVTFVNHTTLLIQTDGINILTDPVWSMRVSPVSFTGPKRHRPPGIRFEDLPPIDLVLVSHNHYDHMDIPTLKRLHAKHRPEIITTLGNTQFLAAKGIDRAVDMDWWDERDAACGLRICCVPAEHFSGRGTGDRDRTLWGGFVLKTSAGTIYFAADTGYGPQFAQIRERYAPIALSLLPIGAYRPTWFMSPVHMSPAEAVRAHRELDTAESMGTHFGTFALADDGETEPVESLNAALDEAGIPRERFWTLDNGESREVVAAKRTEEAGRS